MGKNTSPRWRHLLLECLSKAGKKPNLKGKVYIDESMLRLSGSLLRKGKLRGVSRQQTSIGVAIDDAGHIDARVLGEGHVTSNQLKNAWKNALDGAKVLVHDELSSYSAGLPKDMKHVVVKSQSREALKVLNPINRACSLLQWFLLKHRGITSMHLKRYLDLFVYTVNRRWATADLFARSFLTTLLSNV